MVANDLDVRTISAMQSGTPYASYRKTIAGKVYVTVLNPFTGVPEGLVLFGSDENAVIDVWTEREDLFFKRTNKRHFEVGNVISFKKAMDKPEEKTIEQYSDDELRTVVNQRFIPLQKTLQEIKSEAVLLRMLDIARQEEKSEKIITTITSKLSILQGTATKE
jgi:hypothetical protein